MCLISPECFDLYDLLTGGSAIGSHQRRRRRRRRRRRQRAEQAFVVYINELKIGIGIRIEEFVEPSLAGAVAATEGAATSTLSMIVAHSLSMYIHIYICRRYITVNIDIYPLAQHYMYMYNLLYSVKSDLVQFIGPCELTQQLVHRLRPFKTRRRYRSRLASTRVYIIIFGVLCRVIIMASNNSNTIKASKSSFSIDNILEHKTQCSDPVSPKRHSISSPVPATAFSPATPSAIYDLSREAMAASQYALKNLEPTSAAAAAATLLTPTTLRFNPAAIYSDPASLFYQQMLNLQKNSSLFMPHFQAAAVAAAAAAQPAAYCDQYSPFMDCEGKGSSRSLCKLII